jgi:hypothetical protein
MGVNIYSNRMIQARDGNQTQIKDLINIDEFKTETEKWIKIEYPVRTSSGAPLVKNKHKPQIK